MGLWLARVLRLRARRLLLRFLAVDACRALGRPVAGRRRTVSAGTNLGAPSPGAAAPGGSRGRDAGTSPRRPARRCVASIAFQRGPGRRRLPRLFAADASAGQRRAGRIDSSAGCRRTPCDTGSLLRRGPGAAGPLSRSRSARRRFSAFDLGACGASDAPDAPDAQGDNRSAGVGAMCVAPWGESRDGASLAGGQSVPHAHATSCVERIAALRPGEARLDRGPGGVRPDRLGDAWLAD